MKNLIIRSVAVALLVMAVPVPTQALDNDPIPPTGVDCDSCLCTETQCFNEAYRRFVRCNNNAETVGDFFACETSYDLNKTYCAIEFAGCIISPFK